MSEVVVSEVSSLMQSASGCSASLRTAESAGVLESSVDSSDSESTEDEAGWVLRSAVKRRQDDAAALLDPCAPHVVVAEGGGGGGGGADNTAASPDRRRPGVHTRLCLDVPPIDATKLAWRREVVRPVFTEAEWPPPPPAQSAAAPQSSRVQRQQQRSRTPGTPPGRRGASSPVQPKYLSSTAAASHRSDTTHEFLRKRTGSPAAPHFRFGSWHRDNRLVGSGGSSAPPSPVAVRRVAAKRPGQQAAPQRKAPPPPTQRQAAAVPSPRAASVSAATRRRTATPPQQQQRAQPAARTPRSTERRSSSSSLLRTASPTTMRDISFGSAKPVGHLTRPAAFLQQHLMSAKDARMVEAAAAAAAAAVPEPVRRRPASEAKPKRLPAQAQPAPVPAEETSPAYASPYAAPLEEGEGDECGLNGTAGWEERYEECVPQHSGSPRLVEPDRYAAGGGGGGGVSGFSAAVASPRRDDRTIESILPEADSAIELSAVIAEDRHQSASQVTAVLQLQLVEAIARLSASRDELMTRYDLSQLILQTSLHVPTVHAHEDGLSPGAEKQRIRLQSRYEMDLQLLRAEHDAAVVHEDRILSRLDPDSVDASRCRERLRSGAEAHYARLADLRARYTLQQSNTWVGMPRLMDEDTYHATIAAMDEASEALEVELDMIAVDGDEHDDDGDYGDGDSGYGDNDGGGGARGVTADGRSVGASSVPESSMSPINAPSTASLRPPQWQRPQPPPTLLLPPFSDRLVEEEFDSRRFCMEEEACVVARLFNTMHTSLLQVILRRSSTPPSPPPPPVQPAPAPPASTQRASVSPHGLQQAVYRHFPTTESVRVPRSPSLSSNPPPGRGLLPAHGHETTHLSSSSTVDIESTLSLSPIRPRHGPTHSLLPSTPPQHRSPRHRASSASPGGGVSPSRRSHGSGHSPPHGVKDLRGRSPAHLQESAAAAAAAEHARPAHFSGGGGMYAAATVAAAAACDVSPDSSVRQPRSAQRLQHGVGLPSSRYAPSRSPSLGYSHSPDRVGTPRATPMATPTLSVSAPPRFLATVAPPPQYAEYSLSGGPLGDVATSGSVSPSLSPQGERRGSLDTSAAAAAAAVPKWRRMLEGIQDASGGGAVVQLLDRLQEERKAEREAKRAAVLGRLRQELHDAAARDQEPAPSLLSLYHHRGAAGGGGGGGGSDHPGRLLRRNSGLSSRASYTSAPPGIATAKRWVTGEGFRGSSDVGYAQRSQSPPLQRKPFRSASPGLPFD